MTEMAQQNPQEGFMRFLQGSDSTYEKTALMIKDNVDFTWAQHLPLVRAQKNRQKNEWDDSLWHYVRILTCLANFDWSCPILIGLAQFWLALANLDRSRPIMIGLSQVQLVLANYFWFWQILLGFGQFWIAFPNLGQHWFFRPTWFFWPKIRVLRKILPQKVYSLKNVWFQILIP